MKRTYFACLFLCCLTTSFAARLAQAQTETVLYNFKGGSDGFTPQSRLTSDGAGNLYGTACLRRSGIWNRVRAFAEWQRRLERDRALQLHRRGWTGRIPICLTCSSTARETFTAPPTEAGSYGYGVVFELSPTGTSWAEAVLYSFAGGTDDANPLNGLIMDPAGNLYGRTYEAGGGSGTIFELSKSDVGWTKQVVYSDAPGYAGLTMDTAGNVFGVATDMVFELSPNGHGGWNPTVIHTFSGPVTDGLVAEGTPVLDHAGNLYGTTLAGGSKNNGTVYELRRGTNRME